MVIIITKFARLGLDNSARNVCQIVSDAFKKKKKLFYEVPFKFPLMKY